ncbi:MAG: response regulator, partial [Gammaproteobacteria bacterium]|nr:response regulator [Gammaproteobacteria bacterium]
MSQEETSTEQLPHVLVVDDSRLMRVAVKKILKQDYRLSEAVDGETGWEALIKDDSIQVVISDLSMPNLDGFGLLEKIRTSADERIKNIPVIIITGAEDDDVTRTRALDCGASDFVTKPFDSVQLRARTRSHAQHDQTSRKLTEVSTALEENTSIDPLTGLANKRHF